MALVALILVLGGTREAFSQSNVSLVAEVGDGFVTAGTPNAYVASFRVHPGLTAGPGKRVRLSATAAAQYTNPGVALLGGGRLLLRLTRFSYDLLDLAAVSAGPEVLWGTRRAQLGGALVFDVGEGVVLLTLRGARDLRQDATLFEVALGTDLWLWLHPRRGEDPFD